MAQVAIHTELIQASPPFRQYRNPGIHNADIVGLKICSWNNSLLAPLVTALQ